MKQEIRMKKKQDSPFMWVGWIFHKIRPVSVKKGPGPSPKPTLKSQFLNSPFSPALHPIYQHVQLTLPPKYVPTRLLLIFISVINLV